jgi:hypothetical protein
MEFVQQSSRGGDASQTRLHVRTRVTCGESGLGGTRGLRGRRPEVAIFQPLRAERSARLSSGAVNTESDEPMRTFGIWYVI